MELRGKTIYLRLAQLTDANFIHSLRVDKRYNKHLSKIDGNVIKQREWLIEYKKREILGTEYYFIIHRQIDSLPIGTVRIYDFLGDKDSFCWGSWILNEDKTRYAALETALLIYDFAFFNLGFKRCHMDIRKDNIKVINFHKKFGVKIISETELDLIGHYFPKDYLIIKEDIIKVINNNS
ncbi:MAG: GNAT family N-acetyltransferase [Bacteroidales bacterium]